MPKMNTEQQATLLFRADRGEPRRNLKRFLKDLGGAGSAEELDEVLHEARQNKRAVTAAKRLERERQITARTVEAGVDGAVAKMLATIQLRLQDSGMTQDAMARACGFQQSLLSDYLRGEKLPGIQNLVKMANALGFEWSPKDISKKAD